MLEVRVVIALLANAKLSDILKWAVHREGQFAMFADHKWPII